MGFFVSGFQCVRVVDFISFVTWEMPPVVVPSKELIDLIQAGRTFLAKKQQQIGQLAF